MNTEELSASWLIDNYDDYIEFFKKLGAEWFESRNIYTEGHHILPRCEGGTNIKSNFVRLPYQCHMRAHYLRAMYWKEAGNEDLMHKHLYALQANLSHLFSYPDFCEMVLSIPKFMSFAAKDKETLLSMPKSSRPKPPKHYYHKGYTTKLVDEAHEQSYILRGWIKGKGTKRKRR